MNEHEEGRYSAVRFEDVSIKGPVWEECMPVMGTRIYGITLKLEPAPPLGWDEHVRSALNGRDVKAISVEGDQLSFEVELDQPNELVRVVDRLVRAVREANDAYRDANSGQLEKQAALDTALRQAFPTLEQNDD